MAKKIGYSLFAIVVIAIFVGVTYGIFKVAVICGLSTAPAIGVVVGLYALIGKILGEAG